MNLKFIIHVEDDEDWRDFVKKLLANEENRLILAAENANAAKIIYGDYLINGHVPELVILDISLIPDNREDKGGIEFLELLISFGLTEKTSIIILSENIGTQNLVDLFRKYNTSIVDVFSKGNFRDEIDRFVDTVNKCLK